MLKNRLIIFVITLFFILQVANAVQITTDKTSLDFSNVRRQGYSSSLLTISTDSDSNIKVSYEITGSMKDYTTISSEKTLILNKALPLALLIAVRPDSSFSNGIHEGSILIKFQQDSNIGINSQPGILIVPYKVEITDKIINQAIIKSLDINDINKGSKLIASTEIENKGNIEISPSLSLKISSSTIEREMTLHTDQKIRPGETKTLEYENNAVDLGIGKYNLETKIIENNNIISTQQQDFYVLDAGEPIRKLSLNSIEVDNKIIINKDAKIRATVFNNGQGSSFKFMAEIYKDNNLVAKLETQDLTAQENKDTTAELSFKPSEQGTYNIKGYVKYGSRSTEVVETVFNAITETQSLKEVPLSSNPVLALLIMLIAIFTVVRINKSRNKQKR